MSNRAGGTVTYLSDEEAWALDKLERLDFWAARVLRSSLAERKQPKIQARMLDDMRSASGHLRDYIRELPVSQHGKKLLVAELADRLCGYVTDFMDI